MSTKLEVEFTARVMVEVDDNDDADEVYERVIEALPFTVDLDSIESTRVVA